MYEKIVYYLLIVIIISLCILIGSLSYIVIQLSSSPSQNMSILEISKNGEGVYYSKPIKILSEGFADDIFQINDFKIFLQGFRGVPKEIEDFYKLGPYALYKTKNNAEIKLKNWYKNLDLESILEKKQIILPDSEFQFTKIEENKWKIKWRELTINTITGNIAYDAYYDGIFFTEWCRPNTKEDKIYNPLGFYVTDFDIDLLKENIR